MVSCPRGQEPAGDKINCYTGCYFAKVDLQKAYRSVGISNASQEITGLHWTFGGKTVYLKDSKLCFGSKLSPGIFHRLTQAVKRIMAWKGYNLIIVYLDDFLIISESKEQCAEALNCLIQLLESLVLLYTGVKW